MLGGVRDLNDHELAYYIAEGIGAIATGARTGGLIEARDLAQVANRVAHDWVDQVLRVNRPNDAILSEDYADDLVRLDSERVWILDVIDGTKEYATGRGDWAVHVALAAGGAIEAASVGMPDAQRVFRDDHCSYVDGPMSGKVVVSRNNPPAGIDEFAAAIDRTVRPMGSAGAKTISVLLGDADAYIHTGGHNEWDQAAPVGVAQRAGLHCSHLDGSPIVFNQADVWRKDFLVCRPEITDKVLAAAAQLPPQKYERRAPAGHRS